MNLTGVSSQRKTHGVIIYLLYSTQMVDSNQDNPHPHRPKNPFDIHRSNPPRIPSEPDPNYVSGKHEPSATPIFDRRFLSSIHPDIWDQNEPLRDQRLQDIVLPSIKEAAQNAPAETRNALKSWTTQLEEISSESWKKLKHNAKYEDEIHIAHVFLSSPDETDESYVTLGGSWEPLTDGHKLAADIFLTALMPELGLGFESNMNILEQKAKNLEKAGYAHYDTEFIVVPTILPGINVEYWVPDDEDGKRIVIDIVTSSFDKAGQDEVLKR